jgi:hypothetical protein
LIRRKLLTLIIATFVSISTITIWFIISDDEGMSAFLPMGYLISLFALPAILLYGLPVSFLSEKLTKSDASNWRMVKTFIIHFFFGMSYIFIAGFIQSDRTLFTDINQFWRSNEMYFIASTLTSIFIWGIDEILRLCPKFKSTYY